MCVVCFYFMTLESRLTTRLTSVLRVPQCGRLRAMCRARPVRPLPAVRYRVRGARGTRAWSAGKREGGAPEERGWFRLQITVVSCVKRSNDIMQSRSYDVSPSSAVRGPALPFSHSETLSGGRREYSSIFIPTLLAWILCALLTRGQAEPERHERNTN